MQVGGQSLVDRFLAAKNTIAGQALAKVICKATTEEIMGPKRKHLDFLLQATNEMNVSIPEIADLLIERSQNSSWVVSFKSLITIHHLMCYGNERFQAYMASNNSHLQSAAYLDRTGIPGSEMLTYIRRYANYLNEKREAYKHTGYDFCKVKRGKDDGFLRTMHADKLLKALPVLQKQLDALLQFDVAPNELINGVINSCFFLLNKDLIRLYAAFNDGVINLLEKYFDMNKKQCREALDIYKKFGERTDKVSHFLKVAETSGLERNEIPDLSRTPSTLLEALENHLAHIEGKKVPVQSTVSRHQTEQDVKRFSRDLVINDNDDPQKILEEEAKALEQFNKKKETSSPPPSAPPQPTTTANGNGFGDTDFFAQKPSSSSNGHLLTDDLFSLATPSSQIITNTFPTLQNAVHTSQSKPNFFDDILQPTSTSLNTIPLLTNNQNIPPATKSLQSGDLTSSLNHLIENLDMKDRSKIGKDHQWTSSDAKNQQKIGIGAGTMNTPGTTWPNSTAMNGPLGGMGVWQQPPTTNNPFAAPNGSSQMAFSGMVSQSMNSNTNPFAAQSTYNSSLFNQPQINDPFGNL